MKYYLRDDLRYDYKRLSTIYKTIIAILIAICVVLAVIISINDRSMKNNLIFEASGNDSQTNSIEDKVHEDEQVETIAELQQDKSSLIDRFGEGLKSWINGEKLDQFKGYFSNAFRTMEREENSFLIFQENCMMNYLSYKYEDNDFSTATNGTELKNEEKSSNTEKYLYLIKYKYKENYKNEYTYKKKINLLADKYTDNSLKTLTVLSS